MALQAQSGPAAEHPTKDPVRFSVIGQMGALIGKNESAPSFQAIAGARYRTWFLGLGAGLDLYKFRGAPVFVDVRKSFVVQPGSVFQPFIYADGGIHYSWPSSHDKKDGAHTNFTNDVYMDAGLGCYIMMKPRHALLLSAGYSMKKVQYKIDGYSFLDPTPTYSPHVYDYTLNRISIKLGWQL